MHLRSWILQVFVSSVLSFKILSNFHCTFFLNPRVIQRYNIHTYFNLSIFLLYSSLNCIVVRKHALYHFKSLNFVATYFMAQFMVHIYKCSMSFWKEYVFFNIKGSVLFPFPNLLFPYWFFIHLFYQLVRCMWEFPTLLVDLYLSL